MSCLKFMKIFENFPSNRTAQKLITNVITLYLSCKMHCFWAIFLKIYILLHMWHKFIFVNFDNFNKMGLHKFRPKQGAHYGIYYWLNVAAYRANFPTSHKHFHWEVFSCHNAPKNWWKLILMCEEGRSEVKRGGGMSYGNVLGDVEKLSNGDFWQHSNNCPMIDNAASQLQTI